MNNRSVFLMSRTLTESRIAGAKIFLTALGADLKFPAKTPMALNQISLNNQQALTSLKSIFYTFSSSSTKFNDSQSLLNFLKKTHSLLLFYLCKPKESQVIASLTPLIHSDELIYRRNKVNTDVNH